MRLTAKESPLARFKREKGRFDTKFTELGERFGKTALRRAKSLSRKALGIYRTPALLGFVVAAERTAELDGGEAEFVAEAVGGFGEFLEFFAAVGFEEVELPRAVAEGGERDAEEADFALGVAMLAEEIEED